MEGARLSRHFLKGAWLGKGLLRGPDGKLTDLTGEVYLGGSKLDEAHIESAHLRCAHLEGADLWEAHLEEVDLTLAHLEGASLIGANLEGADLTAAHLEGASLLEANLEKANIKGAYIQEADFSRAVADGRTLVWKCNIDADTKFEGVGLGNIRIYPGTKQLLEYNIRRMNWEEWYQEHRFLRWPVRWFWSVSDYGVSTWRIIITFFILAGLFASIYGNWACWAPPGIVSSLEVQQHEPLWHYFLLVLFRPVYFSIVTMTTLGFGDMYAQSHSVWGHILLTVQVLLGYVLLAALVTRFAILFTAGGPAGKFTEMDEETKKKVDQIKANRKGEEQS